MRLTDFCHPTLNQRAPVLACSRLIVKTLGFPSILRAPMSACVASIGPRNRAFHDARIASADRSGPCRSIRPNHESEKERSTSDTPVASLPKSLAMSALSAVAKTREGRQTVSTSLAVKRSKLSRSEVPSLGKWFPTLHALYRSPIVNQRRLRDFARRVTDLRLTSPTASPASRAALRGFLW